MRSAGPKKPVRRPVSDPGVVSQNREYWDHLAPHRHDERVEFYLDGGSALTRRVAAVGGREEPSCTQLAAPSVTKH